MKRILIALGVVAAALVWFGVQTRPDDSAQAASSAQATTASRPEGPVTPPVNARAGDRAGAENAAEVTSAPASVPTIEPRPPVKTTAAAVFPELSHPVADWRQIRPEEMVVVLGTGVALEFVRNSIKEEDRYVTWSGRNAELPGASFVGVATANGYDAVVLLPGAPQFNIHVRGDSATVTELLPAEEGCAVHPEQAPRLAAGSPGAIVGVQGLSADERPVVQAATAPRTVDVLIAYSEDTLEKAKAVSTDPVGHLDGIMKAYVETANIMLSQSGVTEFAWRHLGVVAAPAYPRTGVVQDDIAVLRGTGALVPWVASTRYQRGADQILLLVGTSSGYAGYASAAKGTAVPGPSAVATMRWSASAILFAHELAHNFGCLHDRAHVNPVNLTQPGVPAPDSDGFWCYGQMWENVPPPGSTANFGTSGTIMSYADWIVPYFSNPSLTIQVTGKMLGWSSNPDLGTHQLGRAETHPKAAFNARVLNEQSITMSGIAVEITQPAIVEQPKNLTVPRGQTATLAVSATGGGLAYQWFKGGTAIAGATSSSLTRTVESADAGNYSVKVTNFLNSVSSTEATLTVTEPIASPITGGGGGGGGAPSAWMLSALTLLVLARRAMSWQSKPTQ
jgi:hypothetical protein